MVSIERVRQYVRDNPDVSDGIQDIDGVAVQFVCTTTVAKRVPDQVVFLNAKIKGGSKVRSSIENAFILGKVQFCNLKFYDEFSITIEDTHEASVSFIKCHFGSKLKIRNKENNDCKEDCQDCEEDFQKKTELKSLKFIDCSMGSSKAHITPYLRCGFLRVDKFVLKNLRVPAGAEVNIGECHFKNFRLSNFRNLGKFKLYKINVGYKEGTGNGTFQLDNTSIGDTDFQSLNLVSFNTRKIFDNILSGINYTNVQWEKPKKDIKVGQFTQGERATENESITEREKITKRAKKRDTYRVLKNVAQRNNDMQQTFAFYAKEVKWHRKLLALTAKCTNICKLRKAGELSKLLDRFTLFFGAYTNNYGQNWALPTVWILGLGVFFYAVLLWVLFGDFCSIFESENWQKFFVFLNPTHAAEFITMGCWGFLAYTIDFSFRVLEGALIYQAIQAFRKYSRKF